MAMLAEVGVVPFELGDGGGHQICDGLREQPQGLIQLGCESRQK